MLGAHISNHSTIFNGPNLLSLVPLCWILKLATKTRKVALALLKVLSASFGVHIPPLSLGELSISGPVSYVNHEG